MEILRTKSEEGSIPVTFIVVDSVTVEDGTEIYEVTQFDKLEFTDLDTFTFTLAPNHNYEKSEIPKVALVTNEFRRSVDGVTKTLMRSYQVESQWEEDEVEQVKEILNESKSF